LATYPRTSAIPQEFAVKRTAVEQSQLGEAEKAQALQEINKEESGAKLRNSFAGRMGRAIEPIIAPLGFDWKMGIGIVSSFAAREVFVSTMSTVYNVGSEDDSNSKTKLEETLRQQKHPDGTPVYTTLTAITLMVFYVFALQCVSTVAIVRRETNSWKWPLFQWVYMGILAWGFAFATFHLGKLLGWG
jgi:ferrous iron transport protein B